VVSEDVFADLAAEQAELDAVLVDMPEVGWLSPSRAAPWTVADVVLHLAQTEELALAASHGRPPPWQRYGETVDAAMDAMVRSEAGLSPRRILARWRAACAASRAAMRQGDPERRLLWVASTLKPSTLATTRLAEHWAHALDITEALGIPYPDTARLRHVAWLAHGTLPYAFRLAGHQPHPVYCELIGPDGTVWTFGDPVRAVHDHRPGRGVLPGRRPAPAAGRVGSGHHGPHAEAALHVLRTYAVTTVEPS
jgi:uncharacterized protein (TIGR03084 family)